MSAMAKLTPLQLRIAGWVLLGIVVIVAAWLWLGQRDKNAAIRSQAEQGERTAVAVSGITDDARGAYTAAQDDVTTVSDGRAEYQRGYSDAKQTVPAVRAYAEQPVPQRLRDLAKQRRLARERLGCAGDGCPSPPADP